MSEKCSKQGHTTKVISCLRHVYTRHVQGTHVEKQDMSQQELRSPVCLLWLHKNVMVSHDTNDFKIFDKEANVCEAKVVV